MGEREERRGERKRQKGRRETRLATEKFPSPERGALERKERKAKERGITSGKSERTLERGKTEREREKSEENFPPRASPRDGNISVAIVRTREENRKEEKEKKEEFPTETSVATEVPGKR